LPECTNYWIRRPLKSVALLLLGTWRVSSGYHRHVSATLRLSKGVLGLGRTGLVQLSYCSGSQDRIGARYSEFCMVSRTNLHLVLSLEALR
jgi:hypothetical protein